MKHQIKRELLQNIEDTETNAIFKKEYERND